MEGSTGKKKPGRPKTVLTSSSKKRHRVEVNRKYRESRKSWGTLILPSSVIRRWKAKAIELQISNSELAKIMLDHDLQKKTPGKEVFNKPSTSTGILGGPSRFSSFEPQSRSTPLGRDFESVQAGKIYPVQQGSDSNLSQVSSISGIVKLQSTSTSSRVSEDIEDQPGSSMFIDSEDNSDNDIDISVNYKVSGQFLYPQELETDITVEDDDLWEPVISCRKGRSCEGLEVISQSEEVHGQMDSEDNKYSETEDSDLSFSKSGLHRILSDPTGSESTPLYIITETRLRDLAQEARSSCERCSQPLEIGVVASGSSAHITWTCTEGHKTHFCCQETLQRSHIGDLKIAAAIVLSGNNFRKVELMSKFSKLAFLHGNTFHMLQQKYVCPAIEEEAAEMFAEIRQKHKGKPLVVLGDGRNDSPGHCAQYLTYTFMENVTKDILHMEVKDKRETALISCRMEVDALLKGLHFLMHEEGLNVTEMVTDAHTTITSRMRQEHPDIKHSYDVWHGAKNLGKKLSKVSTLAANRPLAYWQNHITNHFWHCSKTCGGSSEVFKHKWRGVLHHTTGVHEWMLGGGVGAAKCEHDYVPDREEYLKAGSPPHVALSSIAMDERFMKNVSFYVNFRHTGELESLHNHILMYASKRFAFGFSSYRARNLLAMIDYQRHKDRPVKKDSEGNDKYIARWSKNCKEYVAIKDKVPKEYLYIPALMLKIFIMRWEEMHPLKEPHVLRADDPRRIAPRLPTKSPPKVEDILKRRHMSRF